MASTEFPHGAGTPGEFDSPSLAHALSHPPSNGQLSPELGDTETPSDAKKRRGPYKCSKCSKPGHPVPRLGHVCPYKPRKEGDERSRTAAPPVYEGVMTFAPPPPPQMVAGGPSGFMMPTPPGSSGEVTFTIDPRFHTGSVAYAAAPLNGSVSVIQPKNDDLSDSEDAEGSLYEDEQVEQTLAGTKRKREAVSAGPSTNTRASKRQQAIAPKPKREDEFTIHSTEALNHLRQLDPTGQAHALLLTCRPDGQNPVIYFSPSIAQNSALSKKLKSALDDATRVLAADRAASYNRLAASAERAERAEQRAEEAVRLAQEVQRRADEREERAREAEERARERADEAERRAADLHERFEALMGRLEQGAVLVAPDADEEDGLDAEGA